MMNVIVNPDVYARYRRIWRDAPLLIVEGTVQRQDEVLNVLARRVKQMPL